MRTPCDTLGDRLVARYGSDNGFGWQNQEVVGAQVISVPLARATVNATRAFHAFMASLTLVFATLFVVINAALYFLLVRPVRRIADVAQRLSIGDMSAPEFPTEGAAEVTSLVRSFNRMRKSLDKALRMLEAKA